MKLIYIIYSVLLHEVSMYVFLDSRSGLHLPVNIFMLSNAMSDSYPLLTARQPICLRHEVNVRETSRNTKQRFMKSRVEELCRLVLYDRDVFKIHLE